MNELHAHGEAKPPRESRDERCTAPHPARAFLLALPAFAITLAIALVLWKVAA
jgi:hypothetical protein